MNLMLHGIGNNGGKLPLTVTDSMAADPGDRFEIVLTNPPFGKKSSTTIIGEDGKVAKGEGYCRTAGFLGHHLQRIRLDCVRNEPQSEPFVGQARSLLYRKYLFGV